MSDFKPLYHYSYYEALNLGEQEQWRESFAENQRCRDYIDSMVRENFDGLHLNGDIPQKAIAEFGFDRTRWIFANHIQHYNYDGRISPDSLQRKLMQYGVPQNELQKFTGKELG